MSQQDPPLARFPSPAQAPYEPVQRQLHSHPPAPTPAQPPAGRCRGRGGGAPPPPAPGSPAPGFVWLLQELRVFTVAGAVLPCGSRPRVGAGRAARVRSARFLRKTGLETQPPGSKAGEAAEHLLLREGPRRRFDPRA